MTTSDRLPDATRLGRVRLQITDLDRSLSYYERVIGLRVIERSADAATLATADGTPLVELRQLRGAPAARPERKLGLYHYAILLPDRAALGRFIAHLAEIGERAGASDHAVSEALYLRDPDGLGIEVYADRARNTWQTNGGELHMNTTPLDLESVVAAAGGEPWTGMPAGTTVGHVHLHVGDLITAENFYHTAVGLDVMVRGYPGALFLSAGGYHHHLGLNTWAGPTARPAGENDARLIDWEMVLPDSSDVESAAARLERAGYSVTRNGGSAFSAADPWGTLLRVTAASSVERR